MKRKPALLTLLAVALAAIALLLLRRPPPVPPPVILRPTTAQTAQAQRHMEALQKELQPETSPQEALPQEEMPKGARTRQGKAAQEKAVPPRLRTLRLSEEDLNVTLDGSPVARKMLAARGVKAVQIILSEPANLTIRAAVLVKGRAQNVQLDGSLAPDPKLGLRYTATHAQVGRFPLPPAVVTAQANSLAARLAGQMHGRLPLAIQSVHVEGKMLVLTGLLIQRTRVRPPAPASPPPTSPAHR